MDCMRLGLSTQMVLINISHKQILHNIVFLIFLHCIACFHTLNNIESVLHQYIRSINIVKTHNYIIIGKLKLARDIEIVILSHTQID